MRGYPLDRHVGVQVLLDANRINSRQRDVHVNQLERWHDSDVITLIMSESSQREARADGDRRRVQKALGYGATLTHADTRDERETLQKIEHILFPKGAVTQNHRNDIDIVFNAQKYTGGLLVTNDGGSRSQPGGILGNAGALLALGVRAVRGEQAVVWIAERIRTRDNNIRLSAELYGTPIPEWVAKDDPVG
jgi:hypothetical protein